MSIVIGQNISSLRAQRALAESTSKLGKIQEQLSSGLRINRASDDSAGLSIASKLKSDTRVFTQAVTNLNDGISLLAVADSATGLLVDIVTRLRELASQASSGSYSDKQRRALDAEAQQLIVEHDRIVDTTTFNGIRVFDSQNVKVNIQAGYSTLQLELGVQAMIGDGTVTPLASQANGKTFTRLKALDLNGDGNLDAIGIDSTLGYLNVMYGNGDGTFGLTRSYYTGSSDGFADYQDVNNDGTIDVVVGLATTEGGGTILLFGNSDGSYAAPTTVPGSTTTWGPVKLGRVLISVK